MNRANPISPVDLKAAHAAAALALSALNPHHRGTLRWVPSPRHSQYFAVMVVALAAPAVGAGQAIALAVAAWTCVALVAAAQAVRATMSLRKLQHAVVEINDLCPGMLGVLLQALPADRRPQGVKQATLGRRTVRLPPLVYVAVLEQIAAGLGREIARSQARPERTAEAGGGHHERGRGE